MGFLSFFSLLLNIKTFVFPFAFKNIFRVVLCFLVLACFLHLFCVEIKLLFYFITNVCASFTVVTCRIFCIANIVHFQSLPVKRKRKKERDLLAPIGVLCTIACQK